MRWACCNLPFCAMLCMQMIWVTNSFASRWVAKYWGHPVICKCVAYPWPRQPDHDVCKCLLSVAKHDQIVCAHAAPFRTIILSNLVIDSSAAGDQGIDICAVFALLGPPSNSEAAYVKPVFAPLAAQSLLRLSPVVMLSPVLSPSRRRLDDLLSFVQVSCVF